MTFSSQRNDTALVFVVNKLCFYKYVLHWAHAHTAFQGTWQVGCFMNPAEFQFSGWKELFEIFVSTWVELQQFVCLIFLTKVWQFHKNLLLVQKHICHHRSSSLPANWTMSTAFFLHYDICKTQKKTVFSRSLEPEKKHLQYCTKSSTSSSVSSRRVDFLSQPNDPSGFFWLFFATSALSQEFPEGKWDVTFTDKLIMSKELQPQREATVKAL